MRAILAGGLAACCVLGIVGCSQRSDARAALSALQHPDPGCADGGREGFTDAVTYQHIAGCSGAWTIPGIHTENPGIAPACPGMPTTDTTVPACERQAGNQGENPPGIGCNVADLCAAGWHVCESAAEVAESSPDGCAGAAGEADVPVFFATRQSSNGCGVCATGTSTSPQCNSATCVAGCLQTASTSNDVFGCGNIGAGASPAYCGPLDRFSNNLCGSLPWAWSCNLPISADDGGLCEAYAVTKSDVRYGGVLCCRDANQPPDCSGAAASPGELWPPNHRMAEVQIAGVVDPDPGDAVTIEISSIFQDEPLNAISDGNTDVDGAGVGTDTASVRAERAGSSAVPGNGRVYHVAFVATDRAGARCSGQVTVCVPHDQRPDAACVDGGALYDSTAP